MIKIPWAVKTGEEAVVLHWLRGIDILEMYMDLCQRNSRFIQRREGIGWILQYRRKPSGTLDSDVVRTDKYKFEAVLGRASNIRWVISLAEPDLKAKVGPYLSNVSILIEY